MSKEVKIGSVAVRSDSAFVNDAADIIIENKETGELGGIEDVLSEQLDVLFTMAQLSIREGTDIQSVSEQLEGAETMLFAVLHVLKTHLRIPPEMIPDITEKIRQQLEFLFDEWQRELEK